MEKRMWRSILVVLLVCGMVLSLTGCNVLDGTGGETQSGSERIQAENLMEGITAQLPKEETSETEIMHSETIQNENTQNENAQNEVIEPGVSCGDGVPYYPRDAVNIFSVKLFKQVYEEDKNILISPLSITSALAMTGNGAKGETLKQMQRLFETHIYMLNYYLKEYMEALPQDDKCKLKLANSIWFTSDERFTVEQDFLQENAEYYGADIYRTDFEKDTALKDINLWVENKTDGMVKDILNDIPQDIIMYLINALAFEAEWAEIYDESQVRERIFTTEEGKEQPVELMYSEESIYLEDKNTTGFLKYYAGKEYAFVALLPKEGMSVKDYVSDLTDYQIGALLRNSQETHVMAAIPVFETEYDVLLNNTLMEMGMHDAFYQPLADFTGLGTSTAGNIYMNRVIHKTYITVGPQGTKAGAATVVEMVDKAATGFEDSKTVYLDRPFVYMIVDCENNLPIFMGTVMNVE